MDVHDSAGDRPRSELPPAPLSAGLSSPLCSNMALRFLTWDMVAVAASRAAVDRGRSYGKRVRAIAKTVALQERETEFVYL